LYEYVKRVWEYGSVGVADAEDFTVGPDAPLPTLPARGRAIATPALPVIDRTAKLYIGGKQARPDSGYSLPVKDAAGQPIGEVGEGNRKDIRNAVEAARAAVRSWANGTAHNRAQILYYIAENLAARGAEFAGRIVQLTGASPEEAEIEVERSIDRIYHWAAWADKYDGAVHHTPIRNITLAMNEPVGVIGIACPDDAPLLGFLSLVLPAVAFGNTVVVIPSEGHPLAATDFYQVLDTSDVPGGVVNIVTGKRTPLVQVLAEHDDVQAIWCFGSREDSAGVELASAGNMKRTWVNYGRSVDWAELDAREYLREATQVKNIWVPYGEGIPGLL
jgi:aldehyde dehydrogenase (NAD+)